MIAFLDPLRDISLLAIVVRMVLSFVCGGLIGIEREFKRRSAGLRTHILICLGAAVTTLTSQYLVLEMGYNTDLGRLGAQVIAGIGFVGAGSILVTRRQRVKGLTTAAGLWAAAIVGLCFGAGFYEGGLIAAALILIAEVLFSRLEQSILYGSSQINLYVEYCDSSALNRIMNILQEDHIELLTTEVTRAVGEENECTGAVLSLYLPKKYSAESLLVKITELEHVTAAEEL